MEIKTYDEDGHLCQDKKIGKFVLYDDIKHLLTRPDLAEIERLVDKLLDATHAFDRTYYFEDKDEVIPKAEEMQQAKAALMKKIGGE
jgi:hypothetical protein